MSSDNPLGDAVLLLLEYRRNNHSDGERKLLEIASAAASFLSTSGQLYRFEDFRKSLQPGQVRSLSFADVMHYLEQLRSQAQSAEEKETLRGASDALIFIEASGQHEGLEDYLDYWRSSSLPPVIAAFDTREQADAWLEHQSVPPYKARVLIGGEYHVVFATREDRDWPFIPTPVVGEFIEDQLEKGLPPVVATFDTREQAEAWLAALTNPPRHAFISIGGKHHVAACWKNVNHRAIYPFTLADDLARERQAGLERLSRGTKREEE
ncbi:head protein [Archangium gephyra]|uniref:head protein n=1 Tax=Archangium gephyra TaxID=48 RepID=UPI003B7CDC7F